VAIVALYKCRLRNSSETFNYIGRKDASSIWFSSFFLCSAGVRRLSAANSGVPIFRANNNDMSIGLPSMSDGTLASEDGGLLTIFDTDRDLVVVKRSPYSPPTVATAVQQRGRANDAGMPEAAAAVPSCSAPARQRAVGLPPSKCHVAIRLRLGSIATHRTVSYVSLALCTHARALAGGH